MKITNSEEKITPFGGFNFFHKLFNDCGLPQLIDNQLGKRVKNFGFDYSDIFGEHHILIEAHNIGNVGELDINGKEKESDVLMAAENYKRTSYPNIYLFVKK